MIPTLFITKRDGKQEPFSAQKIESAITKAYRAGGVSESKEVIDKIVERVCSNINHDNAGVEEIQDLVERELMAQNPFVAKKYIIYREWRNIERDKRTGMKQVMDGIVTIEKNDVNLSNANMSAHTPAGQMMTFASELTKDYTNKYLLGIKYSRAHRNGDIHIHDLDYYPTKTTTCIQYDLEDLYERGFRTKNGSIRTPQSIHSYATLATIIFQTNQNEQHGGQSIPAFDFFMAPGVRKSFRKHLSEAIAFIASLNAMELQSQKLYKQLEENNISVEEKQSLISQAIQTICTLVPELNEAQVHKAWEHAIAKTTKDTHQAMEGFIHNLNTMHSRGGNQVVFSSINYGTDTSPEGRLLMRELLSVTMEGLGHGEVPIFPIQIFKVKDGVSFSQADYELAMKDFDAALRGEVEFETPNFDLLVAACNTTAKALFPNFLFLDTPFNFHEKWRSDDPKRYLYELATMGCRTRVFENLHGEKSSVGRGNLSFTSINMPRLAIEAIHEAEELNPGMDKHDLRKEAKEIFFENLRRMSRLVAEQLYDRYRYQRSAQARQYPFMMGNNVWKGGNSLHPTDEVGDVINTGTLGIGFLGGHNAMVAIYGEGHAHNQEAWQTLYDAIKVMNEVADEYKAKYNLNYSVLATPAEGLAGRFTRLDKKKYGIIAGVNDRDYYVNSFHVDVQEKVTIMEKIKKEAPFHAITKGGHITYVELDGEAKKNIPGIMKIVRAMHDEGIGYGSINHPVDTCNSCGYRGVIYAKCPVCQGENISRLRRITGYLTGSLDSWNSAKQAEEKDRVKHASSYRQPSIE